MFLQNVLVTLAAAAAVGWLAWRSGVGRRRPPQPPGCASCPSHKPAVRPSTPVPQRRRIGLH